MKPKLQHTGSRGPRAPCSYDAPEKEDIHIYSLLEVHSPFNSTSIEDGRKSL